MTIAALEQEIFEKFQQLDRQAQQRLIERLKGEITSEFDWKDWIARVNALQSKVHATYGKDHRVDVMGLLREIRESAGG
jgi:hypothetical protein